MEEESAGGGAALAGGAEGGEGAGLEGELEVSVGEDGGGLREEMEVRDGIKKSRKTLTRKATKEAGRERKAYVVATKLEEALSEASSDLHPDLPSSRFRPSEGQKVHPLVLNKCSSRLSSSTNKRRQRSVELVRFEDLLKDLRHCNGGERRRWGGLPDRRIAADEGQGEIPGVHGDGEVEG